LKRAFPVRMPSGVRYWTVLDDPDMEVVAAADRFLRNARLGRDQAESTTKAYATSVALFLRWCDQTGRDWRTAAGDFGGFMTWLKFTPAGEAPRVVRGPGAEPVRGERRINGVLAGVRGFLAFCVTAREVEPWVLGVIYELADSRDLPAAARGEDTGLSYRQRVAHRLHEPVRPVDRASDAEIVALFRACRSARDRLIVVLMARAGLRRSEVAGLRRSDLHLLVDNHSLGCPVEGPHVHVERRDNPNGAWAKSRRGRAVPLDFLVVRRSTNTCPSGPAAGRPRRVTSCWSTCSGNPSARRYARTGSTNSSLRSVFARAWTGI